jgi:hypothetical protein
MRTDERFRGWKISVVPAAHPLFDEVAAMMVDVLRRLGHEVQVHADGSVEAVDADLLLLVGAATGFPRCGELLVRRDSMRPLVALWQQEPLPPPDFPDAAESYAAAMQSPRWRDVLPYLAGLDRLGPLRGELLRLARSRIAARVRCVMRRHGLSRASRAMDRNTLRFMFDQAGAIRQLVSNHSIDVICCSTPTRVDYLRRFGIASHFVPVGWHAGWGTMSSAPRDIDVLFLGRTENAARRNIVPRIIRDVIRGGGHAQILDGNCYGLQRTQVLQRTRIVVNILKYPWEFPGMRLLMSIGCGALVVSDSCANTMPFEDGKHFISAETTDDFVRVIRQWLSDEQHRRRFAAVAHEDVTQTLTLESSLRQILRHCLERRKEQLQAAPNSTHSASLPSRGTVDRASVHLAWEKHDVQ